jgi:hypothetical protein
MGSTFYFVVVSALTAALQVPGMIPVSAQESSRQESSRQESPGQESPRENAAASSGQAAPQPSPPELPPQSDADNRRFVFHRVDGNLLRLDMRTGAVASCSPTGSDWTCVPGRDERAALDRQIVQLQQDNAVLKNALLEHGVPLPGGMASPPPGAGGSWSGDETIPRPPQTVPPTTTATGSPGPGTPAQGTPAQGTPAQGTPAQGSPAQGAPPENEIDRVMDAVERGWRRLVEMMTNLKRDLEK